MAFYDVTLILGPLQVRNKKAMGGDIHERSVSVLGQRVSWTRCV